jgi:glycosyltransferase involved in cell wall biosynthesis
MIFLVLPYNLHTGWGVCSTNLATQISQKHKIRYTTYEKYPAEVLNPIQDAFIQNCKFSNLDYLGMQTDYPIIQATEHDLTPYLGYLAGSRRIGLNFADRNFSDELKQKAKKYYDVIVAGSEWSRRLLEDYGIQSQVIHQGVDPDIFNINRREKKYFKDDFLVFSGGKFEDRKGQDVSIKAYKVLQDKHPDVKLVCAWANMYTSNHGGGLLQESKIDLKRVIPIPSSMNYCMADVYQNTDVGIFPSRCEAGTNLVLMEYMACGKPPIATVGTGQGDIVSNNNGLVIESGVCHLRHQDGQLLSIWEEPKLDSIVAQLEYAYENRSKIKKIGIEAAKTMSKKTWSHMADQLLKLLD